MTRCRNDAPRPVEHRRGRAREPPIPSGRGALARVWRGRTGACHGLRWRPQAESPTGCRAAGAGPLPASASACAAPGPPCPSRPSASDAQRLQPRLQAAAAGSGPGRGACRACRRYRVSTAAAQQEPDPLRQTRPVPARLRQAGDSKSDRSCDPVGPIGPGEVCRRREK